MKPLGLLIFVRNIYHRVPEKIENKGVKLTTLVFPGLIKRDTDQKPFMLYRKHIHT